MCYIYQMPVNSMEYLNQNCILDHITRVSIYGTKGVTFWIQFTSSRPHQICQATIVRKQRESTDLNRPDLIPFLHMYVRL